MANDDGLNQHTTDYSYESIVDGISRLASELGEIPTTRDADRDERLPALDTIYRISDRDWNEILADAGLGETQEMTYDESDYRKMRSDLKRVFEQTGGGYLTMRAYSQHGEFAVSTLKSHFGSWVAACDDASIPPGSRHGERCNGPRGRQFDSRTERDAALYLEHNDFDFKVHKRIPGTDWISDFYLPELGLWVEIDGYADGGRPNDKSFSRKLSHYENQEMDYLVAENQKDLKQKL